MSVDQFWQLHNCRHKAHGGRISLSERRMQVVFADSLPLRPYDRSIQGIRIWSHLLHTSDCKVGVITYHCQDHIRSYYQVYIQSYCHTDGRNHFLLCSHSEASLCGSDIQHNDIQLGMIFRHAWFWWLELQLLWHSSPPNQRHYQSSTQQLSSERKTHWHSVQCQLDMLPLAVMYFAHFLEKSCATWFWLVSILQSGKVQLLLISLLLCLLRKFLGKQMLIDTAISFISVVYDWSKSWPR